MLEHFTLHANTFICLSRGQHCKADSYLPRSLLAQDTMKQVEAENLEKVQLGTGKDYDRSIP